MRIIFLFILLQIRVHSYSQDCTVTKVTLDRITTQDRVSDKNIKFSKIVFCNRPANLLYSYQLIKNERLFANMDTLFLIEELLKFEGDTSHCLLQIIKYNSRSSNFWTEDLRDYSIQLEALYLINLLVLDAPFQYSPIPALKDIQTKEKSTISGPILKKAFQAYRTWFQLIKTNGLKRTLDIGIYPLSNSGISWY